MSEKSRLAEARFHVSEGRLCVDRQRALVIRLRDAEHNTCLAEELLVVFENTLKIFEDDVRGILDSLATNGTNKDGGLTRPERLQITVTAEEVELLDNWRFSRRMPSRAFAIRALLNRGLGL